MNNDASRSVQDQSLALYKRIEGHGELHTLANVQELIAHAARQGEGSCYLNVTESVPYDMQVLIARYLQCRGYSVKKVNFRQRDGLVATFKIIWMPEIQGE